MTPEQKAAFIVAQTAMMNAEMEAMNSANYSRKSDGYSLAYGEEQFNLFIKKWEPVLGYNAVIEFFRD